MRWLFLFVFVVGCGMGPVVIDARRDAGRDAQAPDLDAGPLGDAGDGGMNDPDAGPCPTLPAWVPADTAGPVGESVTDCLARLGAASDDRRPADQAYDLTTFGGPGDEQPVACAGALGADATWYYAANANRFPCGQRIRLVDAARSTCVIVEVADVGPNICVEEAGGRPIWDVSPLASDVLYGVSSAAWSEHIEVFGAPVDPGNPLGPCDLGPASDYQRGFIGGACSSATDCPYTDAVCLTDFPGGACSLPCVTSCPDQAGANAYTACVDLGTVRRCLARCDFTLFATGCRDGYACERRPHPTGAGADRFVCVPPTCG